MGKFLSGSIFVSAIAAGILMYYLQVYAFYDEIPAGAGGRVEVVSLTTDLPEEIIFEDFEGIDSDSSPLRYRACFTTPQSQAMMTETYVTFEDATPLTAPSWFDCYDAVEVGEALEDGEAIAFLGQKDIHWGFDRVVAIMPDGRGFVWHQMNACGKEVFEDGRPVPDHCPPRP